VSGAADRAGYSTRYLTWWMGRIEAGIESNSGFAVGSKLSLADVLLYYAFGETLSEADGAATSAGNRAPFASKERIDAKLASHPKIAASVAAVASHPNVQKWIATRGPQGF